MILDESTLPRELQGIVFPACIAVFMTENFEMQQKGICRREKRIQTRSCCWEILRTTGPPTKTFWGLDCLCRFGKMECS